MGNMSLNRAARGDSSDEWYTTPATAAVELERHRDALRGRAVHCNADGPDSAFARWLSANAADLRLRRLTLTRWREGAGSLLDPDGCGDRWDWAGDGWEHARLRGDGSYRSRECMRVTAGCDIVVTNPPFSLLSDYVPRMLRAGADLLVIGTLSCAKYARILPYVLDGTLRFGYMCSRMRFRVGDGERVLGNARWLTTLPVRRAPLRPHGDPALLEPLDGRPGVLHVPRLDMLADVPGVYAVPLTFLDVWPLDGWRLRGVFADGPDRHHLGRACVHGRNLFARLCVQRL
ncbi:DNA-cytosine methyltransferase [Bifidobacterium castoris]|uniref:DNA-cytosine methyltransferase n=2 Tax=Bifidobacterium castoris TaxID=2306972 RepID=A0A430FAK8_9BIFI|nr:DNA-cytosine methyltransferase [Bifidobacterium castoris]